MVVVTAIRNVNLCEVRFVELTLRGENTTVEGVCCVCLEQHSLFVFVQQSVSVAQNYRKSPWCCALYVTPFGVVKKPTAVYLR